MRIQASEIVYCAPDVSPWVAYDADALNNCDDPTCSCGGALRVLGHGQTEGEAIEDFVHKILEAYGVSVSALMNAS
ncbi:MAG: hypothetical protein WBQ61_06795 [Candidatus Acidiferrum sp.]